MFYLEEELREELKVNAEILSFIEDAGTDGIWYWDLEKPENEWLSPKFWKTFGFNPAEMPHSPSAWQNLIDPEEFEKVNKVVTEHLKNPIKPFVVNLTYTHKNGKKVYIRCHGKALLNNNGIPYRILGTHSNITEQIELGNKHKAERDFLASILNNHSTFVLKIDLQGNYTFVNDYYKSFFNWPKANLIGESTVDGVIDEDKPKLKEAADFCIENPNKKYKIELTKIVNGIKSTAIWEFTGLPNQEGKTFEIIAIGVDISDRVSSEKDLIATKKMLEKTSEIAVVGAWEKDFIKNTDYWSPITKQIHEVADDFEPNMDKGLEFYPEGKNRDRIIHFVTQAIENGIPFDEKFQILTAKKNLKWVRVIGNPKFKAGKCTGLFGTFQDIDSIETKAIELENIKKKLQNILENMSDVVWSYDLKEDKLIFVSPSAAKLYDIEPEDLYNPKHYWMELVYEPDKHVIPTIYDKLDKEGAYKVEYRILTPKGNLKTVINEGKLITDGKDLLRVDGSIKDITKEKELEKVKAEKQQLILDKNKKLTQFAYITSHNLRSNAANIFQLTELISKEFTSLKENPLYNALGKASSNLMNVVSELEEITFKNKNTGTETNLLELILEILESHKTQLNDFNTVIKIDEQIFIGGNRVYLKSIFQNLITNAIKYCDAQKSNKLIEIQAQENDFQTKINFLDNGIGIDLSKNKKNLFQKGFTLTNHPDAHGYGLYMTKLQIEELNGEITVESELGKGSTFTVSLPK
jgi:PAS domain S-box-containing protein